MKCWWWRLSQRRNSDWKPEFSLINRLTRWEIPAFASSQGDFIFSGHSDVKEHFLLIGGDNEIEKRGHWRSERMWALLTKGLTSVRTSCPFLAEWPWAIPWVMFQMDCKMGLILSHKSVVKIKYNYISEYILWRLKHYVNVSCSSTWVERGTIFIGKVSFNAEQMTQGAS